MDQLISDNIYQMYAIKTPIAFRLGKHVIFFEKSFRHANADILGTYDGRDDNSNPVFAFADTPVEEEFDGVKYLMYQPLPEVDAVKQMAAGNGLAKSLTDICNELNLFK